MKVAGLFLLTIFVMSYSQDSLYLRLPEYIYATDATDISIYYDNIVITRNPEKYQFNVNCDVGYSDSIRWNLNSIPTGEYDLVINVLDSIGNNLEADSSKILVTDNDICKNDTLKLLFIGNSLTKGGVYQTYVKQFLEDTSDYPIKFLGTQFWNTTDSLNGILHEGYGGTTWNWHANYLESPFVFDEFGKIDFNQYFNETLSGELPDIITVFLGINDLYMIDATSIETIDERIDKIISDYRMCKFIDSLEIEVENTRIGLCLIPPPPILEMKHGMKLQVTVLKDGKENKDNIG